MKRLLLLCCISSGLLVAPLLSAGVLDWFKSENPTDAFQKKIKALEGQSVTTVYPSGHGEGTYAFSHLTYDVKKSDSTVTPLEGLVEGEVKDAKTQNNFEFTAHFGFQDNKWKFMSIEKFHLVGGPLFDKASSDETAAALVGVTENLTPNSVKKCLSEYIEKQSKE